MALTKEKKQEIIEQVASYLDNTKMTVMAHYDGVSVQAMQDLRRQIKDSGTSVRVIKNNLFVKALDKNDKFKDIERKVIEGQLLFAFNPDDEVAPAQALAGFAKSGQKVDFVGAITEEGQFVEAEDVKSMANLPSKEQLRGQLVGLFSSPLSGLVSVLNGNARGVLQVLQARAESIS